MLFQLCPVNMSPVKKEWLLNVSPRICHMVLKLLLASISLYIDDSWWKTPASWLGSDTQFFVCLFFSPFGNFMPSFIADSRVMGDNMRQRSPAGQETWMLRFMVGNLNSRSPRCPDTWKFEATESTEAVVFCPVDLKLDSVLWMINKTFSVQDTAATV